MHTPAVAAVDLAHGDRDTVADDGEQLVGLRARDGDLEREQRGIGDVGDEMGGDRALHGRIVAVPDCRYGVVPWSGE